jgi:hypothetical protein
LDCGALRARPDGRAGAAAIFLPRSADGFVPAPLAK